MINNNKNIKEDNFKDTRNDDIKRTVLKGDLDEYIFNDSYFKIISER